MLTPSQLATLKADILADPNLSGLPNDPDGNSAIAALYAVAASPDYWVWKSSVSKDDLVNSVGPDGTAFTWNGNGFITRSAGEQAAWAQIFSAEGTVNPSRANVRNAFADIFSGSGNAAANRTHLLAVARRKANRAEKLFASGAGTTANPSTMGFEGEPTIDEVQAARNLP